LVWAALLAGVAACGNPDARAELPASGRVVDSILPREEALRRFRGGLPPADSLTGGTESRDALVAAFVRALGAADTAAIAELAITRSEFAYLYYPTASEGLPPYDLEPGLMWFMLFEQSNQGIRRALQLHGGTPMPLVDYDCGTDHRREGENTVYGPCVVRWRGKNGDTVSARLFSQIIERGGRFKFLSYANKLH
jgi:hypothetical protein